VTGISVTPESLRAAPELEAERRELDRWRRDH